MMMVELRYNSVEQKLVESVNSRLAQATNVKIKF